MVTIKIDTGNVAFDGEDLEVEVARILRWLATKVETSQLSAPIKIYDHNGNPVGELRVTKR